MSEILKIGEVEIKLDATAAEIVEMCESGTYKGFPIEELRSAFEAVESKRNWKRPWSTWVEDSRVAITIAATEFFHADTPVVMKRAGGRSYLAGAGYKAN